VLSGGAVKLLSITFRPGTANGRKATGGELIEGHRSLPPGCVELGGAIFYPSAIESIEPERCQFCDKPKPIAAKGETCGSKACAQKLRHQREREA
jgi:hypothetical protein